jgi:hypothetical protein
MDMPDSLFQEKDRFWAGRMRTARSWSISIPQPYRNVADKTRRESNVPGTEFALPESMKTIEHPPRGVRNRFRDSSYPVFRAMPVFVRETRWIPLLILPSGTKPTNSTESGGLSAIAG